MITGASYRPYIKTTEQFMLNPRKIIIFNIFLTIDANNYIADNYERISDGMMHNPQLTQHKQRGLSGDDDLLLPLRNASVLR